MKKRIIGLISGWKLFLLRLGISNQTIGIKKNKARITLTIIATLQAGYMQP